MKASGGQAKSPASHGGERKGNSKAQPETGRGWKASYPHLLLLSISVPDSQSVNAPRARQPAHPHMTGPTTGRERASSKTGPSRQWHDLPAYIPS